ncbi:MAG: ABC transporter substrate-binding protein [Thermomicrobiales bacterium]|nr:ABC transporter substrate-binding protein [Thermomicrobiales bacterium]
MEFTPTRRSGELAHGRRFTRRRLVGGMAALGAAAVAPGSLGRGPALAAPARQDGPNRIVVASGADAVTLDPHVSFDGQSPLLWRASYETLAKYKGDTLEIAPHLAERIDVSEDGLTYTFKMRPNVTFTDGEPLNAAAAKFSIERQIGVKQGIAYALEPVASMDTPDPMTLVITLSSFADGFLSVFSSLYSPYIISPKAIKDHAQGDDWAQDWLRENMVGTGPYVLEGYTKAQKAAFSRNPNYWQGWEGAHADQALVAYVTEPSSERLMLEKGQVDFAFFLPEDTVEGLVGTDGITVTDLPSFNQYYLALPCKSGPTADKKVRQAISHGFDYQSFIDNTMGGHAKLARGPLPSTFVGFDANLPQYTYDPAKAKQLLAEAGYPDGGFTIKYTYETGYAWKRPMGELFQANMKDLGIGVEIQELTPSAWADLLSNPETADHAYGIVWWPSLKTPYDYLFTLYATAAQGTAGYNWGYYSNPEFDDLIDRAWAEPDEAKRVALWNKAQQILVDDAPALFVFERNYRTPIRDDVEGFVFNGFYIETVDWYAVHKRS